MNIAHAAALLMLGATTALAADPVIRGGTARVDISPPVNERGVPTHLDGGVVYLAGFDINRPASALHDPLYARSLVLETGDTRVAIVSLDLVGFEYNDVLDARLLLPDELGIDHLIVSSTHNHNGPDVIGIWGYLNLEFPFFHLGVNTLYLEEVKLGIVAAVELAVADLQRVKLKAAVQPTAELDLIHDSRDPVIIDDWISALQGVDDEGMAVFTLVNWANHPEALGRANTAITADFPKWVCDEIEELAGGGAIYTSGCLGGLLAPNVPENSFPAAENLGRKVGRRILQALAEQERVVPRAQLELLVDDQVDIFLFNPLFRVMNFLSETIRHDRQLVNCGPFGRLCLEMRTEVNLLSLDSEDAGPLLQIVTVPGELVPELGYDILGAMAGRMNFIIGLGNDELGYILPLNQYDCSGRDPRDCWPSARPDYRWPLNPFNAGDHYEETMSVGSQAAPVIMDAVYGLLEVANQEARD